MPRTARAAILEDDGDRPSATRTEEPVTSLPFAATLLDPDAGITGLSADRIAGEIAHASSIRPLQPFAEMARSAASCMGTRGGNRAESLRTGSR